MESTRGFLSLLRGVIILDFIVMVLELIFGLPSLPKVSRRSVIYNGQIVQGGLQGAVVYLIIAAYCIFIISNGLVVLGTMGIIKRFTSMKMTNYSYKLAGKNEEEYNFDGFSGKEILLMGLGIIVILACLFAVFII